MIWLPLDPVDVTFSNTVDEDPYLYYRNPMYVLFNGINVSDTYRLSVTTKVEFIPTTQFNNWSPAKPSKISTSDTSSFFKDVATKAG